MGSGWTRASFQRVGKEPSFQDRLMSSRMLWRRLELHVFRSTTGMSSGPAALLETSFDKTAFSSEAEKDALNGESGSADEADSSEEPWSNCC